MRAIELFAGVGGFRLGLERAGHEVVWANEWDKYAAATYDKNFGGQIDTRDITKVPAAEVPAHDLICGGFPCQAFSVAGKRRGFDETRGTLFFDIARIAAHHKTKYLLLENVKGLLNHDGGHTFTTIIRTLDELGYDCQWQVLNSKNFGVPQNRERVIIVGHLRTEPRPQIFPIGSDGGEHTGSRHKAGQGIANALRAKRAGLDVEDTLIRQLNPGIYQDGRVYDQSGLSPTLNPASATGGSVVPKIVQATGIARRGRSGGSQYEARTDELANTVRTSSGGGSMGMIATDSQIRRLTPIECERLQGFPDNWTAGVSDTQRYKQMGNAVTVNVIEAVARLLPTR